MLVIPKRLSSPHMSRVVLYSAIEGISRRNAIYIRLITAERSDVGQDILLFRTHRSRCIRRARAT